MRKHIIAILFVCPALFLAQNGRNIYPFLNVPVSARQAALGGDVISLRDYDVAQAADNPSLMNVDMDNRVSINYASYLAGTDFGTASYVRDLQYGHLLNIHAKYFNYGKMPRTDEYGEVNGEFKAADAAIGIGYAYQFEDVWTIGGSVDFVSSKIDNYTSMAVAGTGAVTYHVEKDKETLSLVARNFGYQFKTYNGTRERLPFRIDLGYTKVLESFPVALSVTAHDLQKFNISSEYTADGKKVSTARKIADHFSAGAEFFPGQGFNFRLGYNLKRGNELAVTDQRSFAGLSAGFGIKISSFRFDYTHARYHNSSNLNMFGLMMDLTELTGNRR